MRQCSPPTPPRAWKHIVENVYLTKEPPREDVARCWCDSTGDHSVCGEMCFNRVLFLECSDETCGNTECTNRRFSKREYAQVGLGNAGVRGIGLFADENLDDGSFVIEYTGEVVTKCMYDSRRKMYISEGIQQVYAMHMTNGLIIDSTKVGNFGRFVNHSCAPNCHVQKWCVNGLTVVGIFTVTPVRKGEELTINYNFDGGSDTPCFCKAPECRGSIGRSRDPVHVPRIIPAPNDISNIEPREVVETFYIAEKFLGIFPNDVITNSKSVSFVRLVRALFGKIVVSGRYATVSEVLEFFVEGVLEYETTKVLKAFAEKMKDLNWN